FVTLTRALKAERGEEQVRARLRELAQQLESLDNLAELYESTAEAALQAGRDEVHAELIESAAEIYAFDLQQPEKGLQMFEQVLAQHPGRISSLAGLDKVYELTGQPEKLEQVLRQRLAMSEDDSERVELNFRLGVCLADNLAQPAEGIAALERVIAIDPKHLEARRTLADLYVDANEELKLRGVLESLLADAEAAGDRDEMQRLRTVLARLLGTRLQDHEAAVLHWEAVLSSDAGNSEALRALEDLYPKVGRYEALKVLLEKQIATTSDNARQAQLSSKLGLLLAEHLDDPDTAIAKFEKVLNNDPRNRDALDALRRIYGGMGRHEDLVGVLRRLLRLQTDAAGVKKVRFELAEVLGGPLNRRADAIEAGRRVLDVEPHGEEELQRLEAIFRACEAWEECTQTLDRRVELAAEPGKRIPILYEIAALWEGPIGRREAAARAYERILAIEPGDPVAYRALSDLYVTANEWRKLVALKESRLPTVDARAERLQLLREICEVYEVKLAQRDLAFLAACRAFREDVLDRECGQLMERLAIETDSIEELLDVYDDEVQRVGDELRAIEIHLRMASLCAQYLKDPTAAEGHLNRVFEYDAKNHDALDQLFALYESQGRFEDAVAALERKADSADDLDSKKSILFQICNLYEERLNRREDAVEGFRRVLELDGTDRRAVNNLARLYEALGRWQALVGILQRAVEIEEDLGEQVNVRFRIAGIWETELNNAEQAIAVYRGILEIDPTHNPSLKALERIYTQLDRMSELLGVYEKQVALATSIDEQVRLLAKIAGIWEERFENVEQAVAATERVLLISPINEAAIKNLERLFRQTANWQRLIDVMRQHIELTREPQEIVTLYLEVGDIYYRELNRADKAEEMYLASLDHDPRSRRGIHSLGQLYERSGNWFNALEKLALEADLLGAEPEAVDIHYRMGKINEDMLLDTQSARTSYERALDLDPGYLPAVKALKEIHYAAKEYDLYLKYLIREAEHVEDGEEKTELFTTAARFLQERNADLDAAMQYYNEALRYTPDHMPAAVPLADIEFRRDNWERARELIEIIVGKLDPVADLAEMVRQHYRLGYVNQKLEKHVESLHAFQRAFDLDSTYLPALEAYGQALVQAQRYDDARKVYTTLLMHHKDNLTDAEVVDYFWQLGEINRQLDQPEAALRNLEKALERDPSHASSLRLLGEIQEGLEAYEEAYDAFTRLAGLLGGDERQHLLMHIGALAQNKLNDPYRAIDAYEDANRTKRGDKAVLEAMYELYRETRQIPRATEVLEELLSIEPDEQTRVRLNHVLGEVYRDELKNDLRAVQYFNAALDLDPTYVRAFEAVEKLLTARKQWQLLEENYRAMIQRTPRDSGKIRSVLWRNLAELYRRVLKQPLLASQAYTALCQIDPNNAEYMELLAELLAQIPQKIDEAMATYQSLVPISPEPARAYHALRRLYLARNLHDRAYLACAALRALGKAEQEEQELYAHYAKYSPQKATRALTDRLWDALLVHDQAKGHLATLAALLYKHAAPELLEDPRTLGLGKKGAWERPDSGKYFVNQLKYTHDVLATPPFELFERKRSETVLTVLPVPAPALGLGENNELFKEVPPRHMWFVGARMLTYTRPAFLLPFVLGPVEFQAAYEAALLFVEPRFQGKSDPDHLAAFARRLQRVKEPLGEALRGVFKKILAERKRPDVNAFFEGMEYTAIRAAHLICGDIDVSSQLLRAKDPGHAQLQYRAKMKELLQFIVSEPFFELRSRLGLALKTQAS
ncbi:MAG: tetratricopeptide repeat protein, partial [Deltaproteobacteria bacterium]|nr:tetratricopeptide repeat protein [Deltaproteobacteria bacterium]